MSYDNESTDIVGALVRILGGLFVIGAALFMFGNLFHITFLEQNALYLCIPGIAALVFAVVAFVAYILFIDPAKIIHRWWKVREEREIARKTREEFEKTKKEFDEAE